MSAVLQVQDLNVAFSQDGRQVDAVRGVSFEVARGEVVALVGESGSGKSVTAMSSVALLGANAKVTGSIRYNGQQMVGATADLLQQVRGNEISFIFQEPMTSLNPLHTIEKQIGEAIRLHQKLDKVRVRHRILELLDRVGIPNAENRLESYPHQLSGGQRQRVMIAMALANRPKLLIADEPTTALDVTIEAQIIDLLQDIQRETGMAMLFISHDLGVVRQLADRVIVMKNGKVVEQGSKTQIFNKPKADYTKSLVEAKSNIRRSALDNPEDVILEARNITVKFPIRKGFLQRISGFVPAVIEASFQLHSSESLGIVGESGSGKSTIARVLTKLVPHTGHIYFKGDAVTSTYSALLKPYRRAVQIVFQDPFGSLSPRLSVGEIIAEGPKAHVDFDGDGYSLQQRVTDVLEEVGLEADFQDRYPHEFSGGQRQRIAIARALILRPKVIIFDEPTSALDVTVQKQIIELLLNLQQRYGLSYIFISHDISLIGTICHTMFVMKDGEIVEMGSVQKILDTPSDAYTQTLINAANRK